MKRGKSVVATVLSITLFLSGWHLLSAQVRSGASFLKITPSIRIQSLGGGATGMLDNVLGFYANPGNTGLAREWFWNISYTNWFADIYSLSVNYGHRFATPLSTRTHFAAGLNYQGVREFDSTRGADRPASASDLLLVASAGAPFSAISPNLSAGVNLKFLHSNLGPYAASTLMADAGLMYRTPRFQLFRGDHTPFREGILAFGVAVSNLGPDLKFISERTPLPRTIKAGMAFHTGTHSGLQLVLTADYLKVRDEKDRVVLGSEISWRQLIAFRVGYVFNNRLLSRFSAGIGIRLADFTANLGGLLPGHNNGLQLDMAGLQQQDFFTSVYRGSLTHLPLGPEKFHFVNRYDEVYSPTDSVKLSWNFSRDPDLFDNLNYGILVTEDSLTLARFISQVESQPAQIPAKPKNAIYFVPHNLQTVADSTPGTMYTLLPPLPAGDYYWAVWALDQDNHVRFAKKRPGKIWRFRVVAPKIQIAAAPDTATDLTVQKHVRFEPLRLNVHFGFDKAYLTRKARQALYPLGIALKSAEFRNMNIFLGGHTDERGPADYNLRLSWRRVNSVKHFLVTNFQIPESRIRAVGYGETQPIIPHAKTEAQHAKNRRVEFRLLRPKTANRPATGDTLVPAVLAGTKLHYTILAKNVGKNPARNACIRDVLPTTATPDSFSLAPDTTLADTLIWHISLEP